MVGQAQEAEMAQTRGLGKHPVASLGVGWRATVLNHPPHLPTHNAAQPFTITLSQDKISKPQIRLYLHSKITCKLSLLLVVCFFVHHYVPTFPCRTLSVLVNLTAIKDIILVWFGL